MIQEKKYPDAIALFSQNIAADPKDSESNKYIGIAKLDMGDTKGAIINFTLALTDKNNTINAAAINVAVSAYILPSRFRIRIINGIEPKISITENKIRVTEKMSLLFMACICRKGKRNQTAKKG